eukprot:9479250-Pyramimonas_sp.AAC.1
MSRGAFVGASMSRSRVVGGAFSPGAFLEEMGGSAPHATASVVVGLRRSSSVVVVARLSPGWSSAVGVEPRPCA